MRMRKLYICRPRNDTLSTIINDANLDIMDTVSSFLKRIHGHVLLCKGILYLSPQLAFLTLFQAAPNTPFWS